ncbi:MAG: FliO/MopB family protein [Planctomycetota bacterium]
MARHSGLLLLGVGLLAATAWAQPAAEATANARLIIPDEGPTTVPAAPASEATSAEASPAPVLDTPTTRPVRSPAASRPVRPPSKASQVAGGATMTAGGGGWWQTLGALALVVVLIFLARHILARFAGGRTGGKATGVVEVLSRTAVGSRQSVMLLRVGPRVLVVGAGGETMNTLTEIDDPEQVSQLLGAVERARAGSLSGAFAGALKRQQGAWPADGEDDAFGAAAGPETSSPVRGAVDQMKTVLGRLRGGSRSGGMR